MKCYKCNKIIMEGEPCCKTHDGDIICEECYDYSYFTCNDCGEIYHDDNMTYIESSDAYICPECRDDNYTICDHCEEYYHNDNINEARDRYGDRIYICDDCRDNQDYYYCDDCGDLCHNDFLHYNEEDDCSYCDNCYENHESNIYSYHEFDEWHLYHTPEENPPYYIGYELEVDNGNNNKEASDFVINNLNCICAHDGSLNNGFEIISHPQSYNYLTSEETKNQMHKVFDYLKTYDYKSHDTDTCGLHFHVTRPENHEIIDRILLVMETYKDELIKFSRRTNSQMHWCNFLSDREENPEELTKGLYYIKKAKNKRTTRYMALNLTNSNTIEFRLIRGTLNFDTFYASVELINNIMTLCSDLSLPIEDITWDTLTATPYAQEYVNRRDIHTSRRIYNDNSVEEKIYKFIEHKNEIINLCLNSYAVQLNDTLNQARSDILFDSNDNLIGNVESLQTKISYTQSLLLALNIIKKENDLKIVFDKILYLLDSTYARVIKNNTVENMLNELRAEVKEMI